MIGYVKCFDSNEAKGYWQKVFKKWHWNMEKIQQFNEYKIW